MAENLWKIVILSQVHKTRFKEPLTVPIPKEYHDVAMLSIAYRHSRIADILQVGWETNISHAEFGQLSI